MLNGCNHLLVDALFCTFPRDHSETLEIMARDELIEARTKTIDIRMTDKSYEIRSAISRNISKLDF